MVRRSATAFGQGISKVNVSGLGVTLLAAGGCGPVTPPSDASIIAFLLASSKLNVSIAFPKSIVLIRAITIMIADSDPRLSSRASLNAVLAALGLVALSMHCPSRVNAQTAQAPIAQAQILHPPPHREELTADSVANVGTLDLVATVHVDVTPEHVLNTIDPDTATGAGWMTCPNRRWTI